MRTKTTAHELVLACLVCQLAAPALGAEEAAAEDGWSGVVTPKFILFDFSGGAGDDFTHFLERYHLRHGLLGDDRSGLDFDLDLDLTYSKGPRDLFTLDRRGQGKYNNYTDGRFNAEKVAVTGYYSRYRSATGGIGYLYSPNQAPGGTDPSYNTPPQTNSGYVAQFNDDSGRTIYDSDRETFGLGLRLKPALLGEISTVELRHDGYQRDGDRFSPWMAGGSDFSGPSVQLQRWRGFDQPVDETLGRLSLAFTLSPGGMFELAYVGAREDFDNEAQSFTFGDFAAFLPPGNVVAGTNGTKPLHFVPDATQTTHSLRLSKSFGESGRSVIAAGGSLSELEQDTFTQRQRESNYDEGEISTTNAYLGFNSRLSKTVALEIYSKYFDRENDSTFPAPGLLSATEGERLGVRIDSLETLEYGVAANFRPTGKKSTVKAGWRREDISRDLTFHVSPGITPQRSLYREDSLSDEVYATFIAKPRKGLNIRITPSYLWADETGLVVEPEESLNVKIFASYVTPGGTMVSGYYNYTDQENSNNSFTNAVAPTGADGDMVNQDLEETLNSIGAALTLIPAERCSVSLGADWIQTDFESFYFSTNRRRFEAPTGGITFFIRDRSNYQVDTLSLSLGGSWEASEGLSFDGGYSYSLSDGDVASGLIKSELAPTIDGKIDSALHSFTVGASYDTQEWMGIWARYTFDDYTDDSYDLLSGSLHTLTIGLAFHFR